MLGLYKNIKAFREKRGMSQDELARLVGFKSRSSINKIEMGVNDITQSKLIAIAKALGVSPGELMGETPPAVTEQELSKDARIIGHAYDKADSQSRLIVNTTLHPYIDAEDIPEEQKSRITSPASPNTDTATRIGKKILAASPNAQAAVSQIIERDAS